MGEPIGHATIVRDLKTLIGSDTLGHGYIFYGPSMVGKRTCAIALAQFLESWKFSAPTADIVLHDSKVIDRTTDPDAKDSIGIDVVREIKNFLWQKPNISLRRTLIIDQAELLTTEAQNALLKVTEEPPASSLLILITSDIESIMPTIVSRLPKIYFGPVAQREIEQWLMAEQSMTKTKAASLAKSALGKPGLAYKLMNDKVLQKNLELAQKYLTFSGAARKDFIKKIIDPDDFSLRIFLDAVIMNLAWEKPSSAKARLWHKTLSLYGNVNNFGLNPRLQLEALLS